MARKILGVVAGLAVWLIVVTVLGTIMRRTWREYAAVADAMTFTLPMMLARLTIGALATLVAGWMTAFITRRSTIAILVCGGLLLLAFIPQHINLWDKFPVWYHLTFLISLVPLTWFGGTIPVRDSIT